MLSSFFDENPSAKKLFTAPCRSRTGFTPLLEKSYSQPQNKPKNKTRKNRVVHKSYSQLR